MMTIFGGKREDKDDKKLDVEDGLVSMTNTPTQLGGKGLLNLEDTASITPLSTEGDLSENRELNSASPVIVQPPSDTGTPLTLHSKPVNSTPDGNKPMTGAGLNIVNSAIMPAGMKKIGGLRSLRSVASNAAPLNKLRELSFDPTHEISLANVLLRRKLINQIQFDEVVEKLQASAKNFGILVPISALFELQDIELVNMDSIMNFLVEETKIPFISLKSFRIDNELFTKLPPDVAERLGVVLFGVVGRSMQVALLNPVDKNIRIAISEYLECRDVSFYLVKANEITPVYDQLRAELASV